MTGIQLEVLNWLCDDNFLDDFHTAPLDFDIIQPVLQYGGGSANGGGNYWGVASWYVTEDDGAIWSDELTVKPG